MLLKLPNLRPNSSVENFSAQLRNSGQPINYSIFRSNNVIFALFKITIPHNYRMQHHKLLGHTLTLIYFLIIFLLRNKSYQFLGHSLSITHTHSHTIRPNWFLGVSVSRSLSFCLSRSHTHSLFILLFSLLVTKKLSQNSFGSSFSLSISRSLSLSLSLALSLSLHFFSLSFSDTLSPHFVLSVSQCLGLSVSLTLSHTHNEAKLVPRSVSHTHTHTHTHTH